MADFNPGYAAPGVSAESTADFGSGGADDKVKVPNTLRVAHVTITDTLTSCTLTPQYSIDGGTTWADIDYDQEGRAYPQTGVTAAPQPMTFVIPPGDQVWFRMKSSVDNDGNEWTVVFTA